MMWSFFYEPNCCGTIKLLLRRTLVLIKLYSTSWFIELDLGYTQLIPINRTDTSTHR